MGALYMTTFIAQKFVMFGFPLPDEKHRIGCVDGLRGYLAMLVLVHHFIIWLQITKLGGEWEPPRIEIFNEFGAGSVALFFMTTGLVFYPYILKGISDCNWTRIYISRIFRLVPAIVISVLLVIFIIMARTGRTPGQSDLKPALQWISTWGEPPLLRYDDSGRVNAYVFWSLHFEWLFYLLVLPISALISDIFRRFGVSSIMTPICLITTAIVATHVYNATGIFKYITNFAVGMLGYECFRRPPIAAFLRSDIATSAAILILAIGMTKFSSPQGLALGCFGFFFVCIAAGNDLWGLLRSRGALVLGECSYGIYLMHGLVLNILFVDFAHSVQNMPSFLLPFILPLIGIAVLIIAAMSFVIVERPAIGIGACLARWINAKLARIMRGKLPGAA